MNDFIEELTQDKAKLVLLESKIKACKETYENLLFECEEELKESTNPLRKTVLKINIDRYKNFLEFITDVLNY